MATLANLAESQSFDSIKPGDFFLTTIGGRYPKLIVDIGQALLGEPSEYSHAGIYLGRNMVLEAMPGGAQINELSKYKNKPFIHSYWDLSSYERLAIVGCAWSYAPHREKGGVGYSLGTYASIAMHKRFPNYNIEPLRKYISSTGEMICSQMVDQIYLDAGFQMFDDGRWPGFVMPSSLVLALPGPYESQKAA